MISLQEVGKDFPQSIARRTLSRAAANGSIRAKGGRGHPYIVSEDEAQYLKDYWPVLSSLREALRCEPVVQEAVLFGSYATGHAHAASDLDLMVDIKNASGVQMLHLKNRLEKRLGKFVDLYLFSDLQQNYKILEEIGKTGRPLINRKSFFSKIHHS